MQQGTPSATVLWQLRLFCHAICTSASYTIDKAEKAAQSQTVETQCTSAVTRNPEHTQPPGHTQVQKPARSARSARSTQVPQPRDAQNSVGATATCGCICGHI
jgi:hypothetical protein